MDSRSARYPVNEGEDQLSSNLQLPAVGDLDGLTGLTTVRSNILHVSDDVHTINNGTEYNVLTCRSEEGLLLLLLLIRQKLR